MVCKIASGRRRVPRQPAFLSRPALVVVVLSGLLSGCSGGFGSARLSEPAKRLNAEATAVRTVSFEEDYVDARLTVPGAASRRRERPALRRKLVTYLLGPIAAMDPRGFRERTATVANDDLDRIMSSFREALDLYAPEELWERGGPEIPADERALLTRTAQLVQSVFGPRGAELEVATGLLVLQTLEPKNQVWNERLSELVPWLETGAQLSLTGSGPRGVPTPTDVLEAIAAVWVAPNVVDRLSDGYLRRQERLSTLLRRPLGAANRGAIERTAAGGGYRPGHGHERRRCLPARRPARAGHRGAGPGGGQAGRRSRAAPAGGQRGSQQVRPGRPPGAGSPVPAPSGAAGRHVERSPSIWAPRWRC